MSLKQIKSKLNDERGFTIVELLIVIVVIGILAAITLVSYSNVTARANATSAKSAASTALSKAQVYNVETGSFPSTPGALTSAPSTATYNLTGITFDSATSEPSTAPTSPSVLQFYTCTNGTAVVGTQVKYWDYAAGTPVWTAMTTGDCSGTVTRVAA